MLRLNGVRLAAHGLMIVAKLIQRNGATSGIIEREEEETAGLRDRRQPRLTIPPRPLSPPVAPPPRPLPQTVAVQEKPDMPTTSETLQELKRRLAKELYRIEMDLQGGGRIPSGSPEGRACDCLSQKHHLGIEATAEELMSYEVNPVYSKIIAWMNSHAPSFDPAEITKHPPAYYQALTPEVRAFRKEVMGTESIMEALSPQEQGRIIAKMKEAGLEA